MLLACLPLCEQTCTFSAAMVYREISNFHLSLRDVFSSSVDKLSSYFYLSVFRFKVVILNLNLMLFANDKVGVYSLVLCIDFQYEPTNLQFVLG